MNWGLEDVLAAALLLAGTGLALGAVVRLVPGTLWRTGLSLVILAIGALIWAELAVGLF